MGRDTPLRRLYDAPEFRAFIAHVAGEAALYAYSDQLSFEPGALVLFRGRSSIHRVSPNESDTTRIPAVQAYNYNTEPDIARSECARMTFYGRLD